MLRLISRLSALVRRDRSTRTEPQLVLPPSLPMSTYVLDAAFYFRTATAEEVEERLVSLGALGGQGVWMPYPDDSCKMELDLNRPPYSEALIQYHSRLRLDWTPSVAGGVFIKGADESRGAQHLRTLLLVLLEHFDGVVAQRNRAAGPKSVFTYDELRNGANRHGLHYSDLIGASAGTRAP